MTAVVDGPENTIHHSFNASQFSSPDNTFCERNIGMTGFSMTPLFL